MIDCQALITLYKRCAEITEVIKGKSISFGMVKIGCSMFTKDELLSVIKAFKTISNY